MLGVATEPGSIFAGDFRIVRSLSRGSMGAVFLAEQLSVGRPCALKITLPGILRDERALARFEREAAIGAKLSSPHIVRVHGAGIEGGLPWIAMEYVQGQTLEALVRQGLDPWVRGLLIDQLFAGVIAVHEAGFVHRDLKPENMLVSFDGGQPTLKLLDFGISKHFNPDHETATSAGLGSPLWTAPEQATDTRGLAPSADVWALGLIVFFLYTGRLYWKNADEEQGSVLALVQELAAGALEPPSVRLGAAPASALPAGFDGWFARCVHRSPEARYPDARAAYQALREVLDGRPAPEPAPGRRVTSRPPPPPGPEIGAIGSLPQAMHPSLDAGPATLRPTAPLAGPSAPRPAASPGARPARPPRWLIALALASVLLAAAVIGAVAAVVTR